MLSDTRPSQIFSYPGITAEVLPNLDWEATRAYEAVLNCGGAFLTPSSILMPLMRQRAEKLLSLGVSEIVLASDRWVLESADFIPVRQELQKVFGKSVYTLPIERSEPITNNFGMRVLSSRACSTTLQALQEQSPDAFAITSLPYADPTNIGVVIGPDVRRLDRSLSLFAVNNRTIPTELAKDATGVLDTIDMSESLEGLDRIFEENPDKILVFKPIGQRAGGTSTQIVGPAQRAEFREKWERTEQIVYEFFDPVLVQTQSWEQKSLQLRPFVIDSELQGFCIKMPANSLNACIDATGKFILPSGKKWKLADINRALNSSSGLSVSAFFDKDWVFQGGSKGMKDILTQSDVQDIKVEGRWNLGNPEFALKLAMSTISLVSTVQARVNNYMFTWAL